MHNAPAAFPRIARCDSCLGSGNEGHEDFECHGCKGTGGAECLVCHEPSPEQSTAGVCERCTTLEGIDEAIDELPAVTGSKLPTPAETYEVVLLLRLIWRARAEWALYRQAQAARPEPVPFVPTAEEANLPF